MVKDPNLLVFFDVDYTLFANMFNVNGEMLSAVPSGTKGKIESAYDDFTKYLLYTNDPYKYVHPLKSKRKLEVLSKSNVFKESPSANFGLM